MKKTYWAETAARLIAFLLVGVFSVSAWAEEPLVGDLGPEVIGPGVVVMPFPTHMELILDRFLKDPGRFIGARVNPNEYLVGPGDVFTVSFVSDETEDIGVRISATGVAFIKSVGEVQVDGVTLADALAAISDEVRRIYTRADFKVQTAAFRFVRVDIIGEVVNPGTYYLPAFWRTSEAIELAGGLMPDALSRKIILRGDNRIAHFDKVRFMATGDEASNPMISGGHTIVVPNRDACTEFISVSGLVHRPGIFAAVDSDRIADYLEYAGGVRGTLADMDVIISNPQSGAANILSGDMASDLDIKPAPGDNITVRHKAGRGSSGTVMIFGAVERPGMYPLPETPYTVQDLLQASGGVTHDGYVKMMQIFRVHGTPVNMLPGSAALPGVESGMVRTPLDTRMVVSSDPRRPIDPALFMLEDGDSLYVPRVTGMVSVIGAVASPGLVFFQQGEPVSYYLEMAGGLGNDADRDGMVVVNPHTGGEMRAAGIGELFDGEIIFVPRKENSTRP